MVRAKWRQVLAAFGALVLSAGGSSADPGSAPAASGAGQAECSHLTKLPVPPASIQGGDANQHLPADSVTHHQLRLAGRTLCFTATAGKIQIKDGKSFSPIAEIAYISYALEGAEHGNRPVAFVMNGGPGNASAWLQIGGIGPWRLPVSAATRSPSAPIGLVDNADTWLDFTDLVFIDPVGTGYSRSLLGDGEARQRFYGVDSDIQTLTTFIWRWLDKSQRLGSPKFIVGESYGGFRGPRLAHALQTGRGVGVNGMVLISPVLDFGRFNNGFNTLDLVAHLPSFAATALAKKGQFSTAAMADVEAYAENGFLSDLLHGINDKAAVGRLVDRVSALTGLDPRLVANHAGRISASTFQREIDRSEGRVTSIYDGTVTGYNPEPESAFGHAEDPLSDALSARLATAMTEIFSNRLGWRMEGARYQVLNLQVNREWDWGRGEPDAIEDLRKSLALDPNMRVLITHGYTDLITPYFETKMLLDQIPVYGSPDRLRLKVYPGGHMQYLRDDSRQALRGDAKAMFEAAASPPVAER